MSHARVAFSTTAISSGAQLIRPATRRTSPRPVARRRPPRSPRLAPPAAGARQRPRPRLGHQRRAGVLRCVTCPAGVSARARSRSIGLIAAMMPPMMIRPATAADADTLAATVAEGFDSYRAFAPAGWEPPDMGSRRERLGMPGTWCESAERDGEAVGHVAFMAGALAPAGRGGRRQRRRTCGSCSCGAPSGDSVRRSDCWPTPSPRPPTTATMRPVHARGPDPGAALRRREGWTLHGGAFDGGLSASRSSSTGGRWADRVPTDAFLLVLAAAFVHATWNLLTAGADESQVAAGVALAIGALSSCRSPCWPATSTPRRCPTWWPRARSSSATWPAWPPPTSADRSASSIPSRAASRAFRAGRQRRVPRHHAVGRADRRRVPGHRGRAAGARAPRRLRCRLRPRAAHRGVHRELHGRRQSRPEPRRPVARTWSSCSGPLRSSTSRRRSCSAARERCERRSAPGRRSPAWDARRLGLALAALSKAPAPSVAAVRETSVVIAAGLAAVFTAEPVGAARARGPRRWRPGSRRSRSGSVTVALRALASLGDSFTPSSTPSGSSSPISPPSTGSRCSSPWPRSPAT